MSDIYPWEHYPLHELEEKGIATLGRGNIISKIDIQNNPGGFPIYSSSAKGEGLFGAYGDYMFDEEMITWSVDGGGNLFYRPRHKFSVTNVSGYMRLDTSILDYRFAHAALALQHSKLTFDYQTKAHPSVIRNLYHLPIPPLPEQKKIAEILSGIDGCVTAYSSKIRHLEQFRSAAIKREISGSEGTVTQLGELFDIQWGNTSITKSSYQQRGHRAYSASGPDGYLESYEHDTEGIVISAIGAQCGKVFWAEEKWTAIKNTMTITANGGRMPLKYLFHILSLGDYLKGEGGAQPFISQSAARAREITIPQAKEMDDFCGFIDSLDLVIKRTSEILDKMKYLKQSVSADLLSGRKRVSV